MHAKWFSSSCFFFSILFVIVVRLHLTICRKGVCLELSTVYGRLLANGNASRAEKKIERKRVCPCKTSCLLVEETLSGQLGARFIGSLAASHILMAIVVILCERICLRGLTECINRCKEV